MECEMFKFKKQASADDAYLIAIRALGDALIQCEATGKHFDPMLFSRKVIEIFEQEKYLLTQLQADQVKRMRSLINEKLHTEKVQPILSYLREISADMWSATHVGDEDMMRQSARAQMFAAAYLLRFFQSNGLQLDLSPKIIEALEKSYSANINDFLKSIS
jgi:hypothetical protein